MDTRHLDSDPDAGPDSTCHPNANPDAHPDSTYNPDADPDLTYHPWKSARINRLIFHTFWLVICKL
jgi:hypothetical protein